MLALVFSRGFESFTIVRQIELVDQAEECEALGDNEIMRIEGGFCNIEIHL